jgi:hypothetical protein
MRRGKGRRGQIYETGGTRGGGGIIWIGASGCVAFTLSFTEFVPESDLKFVAVTRRGGTRKSELFSFQGYVMERRIGFKGEGPRGQYIAVDTNVESVTPRCLF